MPARCRPLGVSSKATFCKADPTSSSDLDGLKGLGYNDLITRGVAVCSFERIELVSLIRKGGALMEIALNTDVYCADDPCGRSTYIIVNPITDELTHLVVKEKKAPHAERLVPLASVAVSTPNRIDLQCTKAELEKMELFVETQYIQVTEPMQDLSLPDISGYWLHPHVVPVTVFTPQEIKHIPPDELAVRRGARVNATDGYVGQVDELLVNPTNGHITHLVMRKGHLWGEKDVSIPVSEIDHSEEKTVYLKLDKQNVGKLPTIPIRRKQH